MPDKTIEEMSASEMAVEFNRLVEIAEANHTGLKPLKFKRVKAFKDRKSGLARLAAINGTAAAPVEPTTEAKPKKTRVAKAKSTKTKNTAAKPGNMTSEFAFKAGGERDQLLLILKRRMNHQVPRADFGKIGYLLSKIALRIKRKKLPYRLVKEKTDAGFSYGLYSR
jgi:hypothetical protein